MPMIRLLRHNSHLILNRMAASRGLLGYRKKEDAYAMITAHTHAHMQNKDPYSCCQADTPVTAKQSPADLTLVDGTNVTACDF